MRVLLDHNLPHKLRSQLGTICGHEVVTASHLGWGALKNGELLLAAEENGFDIFVTGDGGVIFEQNLAHRRLAVIALSANNWPIIKDNVTQILAAIDMVAPGSFQAVDCGTFSRRNPRLTP